MARPKGSGINTVTKRKADGTTTSYFYDRASGAFLGHDRAAAEKRVKQDAERVPKALDPQDRSLSALISLYMTTPAFKTKKPSTRHTYRKDLEAIRLAYGDLPVRGFRPGSIERIKISQQASPSKANKWIAMLRIVFNLAVKLEWIVQNPAAKAGRVDQPPRQELWTADDEERFAVGAPAALRLAQALLLYTLQRPSDVLAMTLGQVSERNGRLWISLRQQKTGELVDVPVHVRLDPLLRERLATRMERVVREKGVTRTVISTLLVTAPKSLAWAYRNFARSWDAQLRRANLRLARQLLAGGMSKDQVRAALVASHRRRQDLRRTGIVRLAEAGATTPQIAAVSGHEIDYCQRIINTYLPRRSEVALGAIEAWERQGGSPKVISMVGRTKN